MKVLLIGSSQKRQISEMYAAAGHKVRIREWAGANQMLRLLKDVLWCDAVYIVYGRNYSTYRTVRLAAALKRKIIIHWIGTDVLQAAENCKNTQSTWNMNIPHIDLACAPHLVEELSQIGIFAEYAPILPVELYSEAIPLPADHAILAYIPEEREEFYGMDIVKHLAQKHSEIPFHIVANSGKYDACKQNNLHYHGMLSRDELKAMYEKCSILLRCTQHDGLPVMILEAMLLGRQVIYNFTFPHAHTPKSRDIESIEELFAEVTALPPQKNHEGMEYVRDVFTTEKLKCTYEKIGII